MLRAQKRALSGLAALVCCLGLSPADALHVRKEPSEARADADMARLERLAGFQAELAQVTGRACDAGSAMSCESAAGAKLVADRFEGALALCRKGDQTGCATARSMADDIAANQTFACENLKLQSCPENNEAVSNEEANPEAASSVIKTPIQGPVVYQGETLPSSGAPQGPVPGVPTGAVGH